MEKYPSKTCVERILNYGCLDPEKKELIDRDCKDFRLTIPTGIVNVSCNDKLLFDTLMCNKMISEGACNVDVDLENKLRVFVTLNHLISHVHRNLLVKI